MKLLTHNLAYFLREALQNVRHSPALAVVSVLTIAVSLILVGFFGALLLTGQQVLDSVGKELRISVYLDAQVPQEKAEKLQADIAQRPDVASAKFLSAEQDRARNQAVLSPELTTGLDPQSIPGSPCIDVVLEPSMRTRAELDELASWLTGLESVSGVDDVHFSAERYRFLYSVLDILQFVGWLIGGVVLFASVFFVFGTIRLAVLARSDEIEVLKLVGATLGFIRAPFYIEGALQGLLGAVVALAAVGALQLKVRHYVEVEHSLNFQPNLLPWGIVLWFVAGGVMLGLLGSAFSLQRHLRS